MSINVYGMMRILTPSQLKGRRPEGRHGGMKRSIGPRMNGCLFDNHYHLARLGFNYVFRTLRILFWFKLDGVLRFLVGLLVGLLDPCYCVTKQIKKIPSQSRLGCQNGGEGSKMSIQIDAPPRELEDS